MGSNKGRIKHYCPRVGPGAVKLQAPVLLSCRSSVVCGRAFSSTIMLKTYDVGRSKPTIFASPWLGCVFGAILFGDRQFAKEGFVLFGHALCAYPRRYLLYGFEESKKESKQARKESKKVRT